jgi:hypothetical protein
LVDVAGKTGAIVPLQIVGIALNDGVVLARIVIVLDTIAKQPAPEAVKT